MRHARPADLEPVDSLLTQLRSQPGLLERKPGNFTRGSRAFLHFHVDADGLWVDVRLAEPDWTRLPARTPEEQRTLLHEVAAAVGPPVH